MPDSSCPCGAPKHPATLKSPPNLTRVPYRVGDFASFREALLVPLPDEAALISWRPGSRGDLAVQIAEWWAYIADILTFYDERSINENLLATAQLDSSVRRLVRILGYRPKPGIAGKAILGALLSEPRNVALPAGFRVESKPPPGKSAQTFETSIPVELLRPDAVSARPVSALGARPNRLYLDGNVAGMGPGELLLLLRISDGLGQVVKVRRIVAGKDPEGRPVTEIAIHELLLQPEEDAAGYQLLKSRRSAGLWKFPANPQGATPFDVFESPLSLESLERTITPNEQLVVQAADSSKVPLLFRATGTAEAMFYTNGNGPNPPSGSDPLPIPVSIPITRIGHTLGNPPKGWDLSDARSARLLFDWHPLASLINAPICLYTQPADLQSVTGQQFQVGEGLTALLEDSEGYGGVVTGRVSRAEPTVFQVSEYVSERPSGLKPPLRVLQDVISLTRGKTVSPEVIGIGNAGISSQEFLLQKSPLTYFQNGPGLKSSLQIYVGGIQWTEVPHFLEQPPDAQVFVTSEDDEQRTHVHFGDGIHGATLPSGVKVEARYRIGSGADDLDPGSLTVVSKPVPGLRAVRQPLRAGGGADPDPPGRLRRLAPRSVLSFGRAIAADDYETIALGAAGVTRAKSVYGWDAEQQRATVRVFVGDTAQAAENARSALLASADPNRSFVVQLASVLDLHLVLTLRIQQGRLFEDVQEGIGRMLTEPDAGLFGSRSTQIGVGAFFSQIYEACLEVPGAAAVLSMQVQQGKRGASETRWEPAYAPRIRALEDEYLRLLPENLQIYPEGALNG